LEKETHARKGKDSSRRWVMTGKLETKDEKKGINLKDAAMSDLTEKS